MAPEARTKHQETKQKQMEALSSAESASVLGCVFKAALVLMAAGASTDDVDDMLAARRIPDETFSHANAHSTGRSAMEAELDPFHSAV